MPPKLPSPSELFALGVLFWDAMQPVGQIELHYQEAGPQRSAAFARGCGLQLIEIFYRLVRAGMHIQYLYAREESGDDSMRAVLAGSPVPSAIFLLCCELSEVHEGRISLLLRHDAHELGEVHLNNMRRYIRAGAAAAVQVLMETGMREKDAAKLVTDTLNNAGYINSKGPAFSQRTIMDWRKRSGKLDQGQYQNWLRQLRETVGRVEQLRQSGQSVPDKDLHIAIVWQLSSLCQTQAYRVEPV